MKSQTLRPIPADALQIDQLRAKHRFLADRERWLRDLRNLGRLDSWLIGGRVVYSESEVLALATYSPAKTVQGTPIEPPEVTKAKTAPLRCLP